MSRLITLATTATLAAGIVAAEMQSPGITFLAIDVAGLIAEKCIDAFRWVAAFIVVGFLAWKASAHVTRRDTLQEVASAAGRKHHAENSHPEARFN